jgi:16S rRNA (guanine(966)-N(2))-methyltransferase RsmD
MRIIAGEFRGRKLLPPAGLVTRPVTDRVKQSMFDCLADLVVDAAVYDCFAGTGSMGLECLSRGGKHVTFFENDGSAVAILRKNIAALRVEEQSRVVSGDLFAWFARTLAPKTKADLLFLDPPYRFLNERPDDLRRMAQISVERHLNPGVTVIFRHDSGDALDLPPLERYDVREYGGMTVEFLRCPYTPTSSSPPPTPHG